MTAPERPEARAPTRCPPCDNVGAFVYEPGGCTMPCPFAFGVEHSHPSPKVPAAPLPAVGEPRSSERLDGSPAHIRQIAREVEIWLDRVEGKRIYASERFDRADVAALQALAASLPSEDGR